MNQSARVLPVLSDPLGDALYRLRLNGSLYCQSDLTAPWGMAMPPLEGKMMFHIVMKGECWLSVPGKPSVRLPEGGLALLPKGQGHSIASKEGVECVPFFDLPVQNISDRYEFLSYGQGGEQTVLMCGVVSFDATVGAKLISQLPPVLTWSELDTTTNNWLHSSIRLIAAEAKAQEVGGETIMSHLADIIIIHMVRHWVHQSPEAEQGWLGALKDARLGKALMAIHSHPANEWTVDELAQAAGMSRSGFSARFSDIVGTPVKQYLTEWRMNLARARLMSETITVGELSEQLGYQSEAAFSRAYKRVMGVSPGRQLKS